MSKLSSLAPAPVHHLHQLHRAAKAAGDKGNVQTSKYSGQAPLFSSTSLGPATSSIQKLHLLFFHNVIGTNNFKVFRTCSAVEFRTCNFSFSARQLDIVSQHLGPTVHLLSIAYMQNVHKKPALHQFYIFTFHQKQLILATFLPLFPWNHVSNHLI